MEALDRHGWTRSALVRVAGWLRERPAGHLVSSGPDLVRELLLPAYAPGGD